MTDITYFTKVQSLVERWITEMGFKVKAEVDVEQYRVDLSISELEIAVEIDGPSHRKLPKVGRLIKNNSPTCSKRDTLLLQYYRNGIFHIPVDIDEDTFKTSFNEILKELS